MTLDGARTGRLFLVPVLRPSQVEKNSLRRCKSRTANNPGTSTWERGAAKSGNGSSDKNRSSGKNQIVVTQTYTVVENARTNSPVG
jgi:hypothetical protein